MRAIWKHALGNDFKLNLKLMFIDDEANHDENNRLA